MGEKMTLEQVRDLLREDAASPMSERGFSTRELTEMADAIDAHLTQPAQAVDADAQWALRFKAVVNVIESEEDQPTAAACGLLLIDSCMGKNAAKVTLNFDGVEHKDGSDLGDWIVTVERKRKPATLPKDSNGAEGVGS